MIHDSSNSEDDNLDPFIYRNRRQRRRKVYKERINMNITDFKERFRITPEEADNILNSIGIMLQSATMKSKALTPKEQFLLGMRFLATGSFYRLNGDAHGVSAATVCRSIKKVINAINERLFDQTICWPQNNDALQIPQSFYRIARFPRVAGCIDGTLIKIISPTTDEDQFVDRHGDHSLNCMVVCGPNLKAYYVSARWPGRLNDKRVLNNSGLFTAFENNWRPFPNAVLLGDSGYSLKNWLLVPIGGNNLTADEEEYNRRHRSTRRLIECFFGVLKQRFNCLNIPLRVNPVYAGNIFKACCVIQNIISQDDNNEQFDDYIINDDQILDGPGLDINDPRRDIIRLMH